MNIWLQWKNLRFNKIDCKLVPLLAVKNNKMIKLTLKTVATTSIHFYLV